MDIFAYSTFFLKYKGNQKGAETSWEVSALIRSEL